MSPNKHNLRLDLFIDVYFAILFTTEDRLDPLSVDNRSGILLNFGGVTILCNPKLQTEITLPTLDFEYVTLSRGIRRIIHSEMIGI